MCGNPWSARDLRKLRLLYPNRKHSMAEIAGILGRTPKAVRSRAKLLRVTRGFHHPWSKRENAILRKFYPNMPTRKVAAKLGRHPVTVYPHASKIGLRKTEAYLNSSAACRMNGQNPRSIACRFGKGHIPANKGLRRPGYSIGRGRMQETQFKKGQLSGAAQKKWVPVGTIKADNYGYLRLKIADERNAGPGALNKNWVFLHRFVWEQAHGPIPPGHWVWWKDRNHNNCALENLELLTDQQHMARTTVQNLPPALRQVIQLAGALKRKIRNKREKDHANEKQAIRPTGPSICSARRAVR